MHVVGLLARLGLLHWPAARDSAGAGRVDRPKVWLGHIRSEMIACGQLLASHEVDAGLADFDSGGPHHRSLIGGAWTGTEESGEDQEDRGRRASHGSSLQLERGPAGWWLERAGSF